MSIVTANGTRLWYDVQGNGAPLVVIGGFGIAQNQFDFAMPYLTPHFRVVNWCGRGQGLSDWTMTEPYTLEHWVEDLRAVMDAAGIERTSIWGTSTGAPIGIRFAAKYPERVDALITYPWFRCDDTWRQIFDVTWRVARTFGLFTLARVFSGAILPRELLHAKVGIDFEEFEAECFRKNINISTLKNQMEAFMNVDLSGDVQRLTCRTLLLMGNESPLNEERSMSSASFDTLTGDFLSLKPDAEVCAVPGTGSTYCMITHPEQTTQAVIDYLRR